MVTLVDIGHGRGKLAPAAAASLARIDAALGHALQITEAWRDPAKADENYRKYLAYLNGTGPWAPIALPGNESVHCEGGAIDTNEQRVELLREHGWIRTVYRWVNGVWTLMEDWHFEYRIDLDTHLHDPAPAGAQTEEDTVPEHENKHYAGTQDLGAPGKWWPLLVSSKTEHRIASTAAANVEVGDVTVYLELSGGTPGQAAAQVRLRHEILDTAGKVTRTVETPIVEIIATTGATYGSFNAKYRLGKNYRTLVVAQAGEKGVKVERVEYVKNYWRS